MKGFGISAKFDFGLAERFELTISIRLRPRLAVESRSRWIWRRSISWTSKQFGSSMPARTKVSRCCTARLISRNGCRGSGKKRKLERIGDEDIAERDKE